MNAEKQIRQRARASLASNWFEMITAILLLCAVLISIYAIYYAVFFALGLDSVNIILSVLAAAAILFVSPMMNAVLKMAFNISAFQNTEICDVFYFFGNVKTYLKTVAFNLLLAIEFLILSCATDIYGIVLYYTEKQSYILLVGSVFLKILIYFLFIHYPLLAYSIFERCNIKSLHCGWYHAAKKIISAVKLFFSFTGWILLCFFVVPVLYVLPYLLVAMADLFAQEFNEIAEKTEV